MRAIRAAAGQKDSLEAAANHKATEKHATEKERPVRAEWLKESV